MFGRLIEWVSLLYHSWALKRKFDKAISNINLRRERIGQAISKTYESTHDLGELINRAQNKIVRGEKVAIGAADYYVDDPSQPKHRQAAEEALSKVADMETRITEWRSRKEEHERSLIDLQRAEAELEERLGFLRLEKPHAIATMKALYYQISLSKLARQYSELDPNASDHFEILKRCEVEQKSWEATRRLLDTDPMDIYIDRATINRGFDDLLRERRAQKTPVMNVNP